MNPPTAYSSPPSSHVALRALLRLIDMAIDQKNSTLLDCAQDLTDSVPEVMYDVRELIRGHRERFDDTQGYFIHTDRDMHELRNNLERVAYGNFQEAAHALLYDLQNVSLYYSADECTSRVFRPELFDDAADQKIWKELSILTQQPADLDWSREAERATDSAIITLRSYLQKYYGPFIPILTATYLTHTEHGSHGVSVRAAWDDARLRITTQAPFYEELDDYFIHTAPVESLRDFTPACFPATIGSYTLMDTTSSRLFAYEL